MVIVIYTIVVMVVIFVIVEPGAGESGLCSVKVVPSPDVPGEVG